MYSAVLSSSHSSRSSSPVLSNEEILINGQLARILAVKEIEQNWPAIMMPLLHDLLIQLDNFSPLLDLQSLPQYHTVTAIKPALENAETFGFGQDELKRLAMHWPEFAASLTTPQNQLARITKENLQTTLNHVFQQLQSYNQHFLTLTPGLIR